jgi:hypothetical protein
MSHIYNNLHHMTRSLERFLRCSDPQKGEEAMRTMSLKKFPIPRTVAVLALLTTTALSACQPETASAARDSENTDQPKSFVANLMESWGQTATHVVPAGTPIHIRLTHALSSSNNQPGDSFEGLVDQPIYVDEVLLVPEGAKVEGILTDVKPSGKVKGVAEMQLDLRTLTLDGRRYDIDVHGLTFRASKTTKKDAAVIAGSSAVGAVVGALTGGGKGAAVGAGVGGGAGTGYVLLTEGDEVKLSAERRIRFTLADPVELPEPSSARS